MLKHNDVINMNKVQVENVKQFPEQNYIVVTVLIEVWNL